MNNKREWQCGHCGKWLAGRDRSCLHLIPQPSGYPKRLTVHKKDAAAIRIVRGRPPSEAIVRDTTRPPHVVGRPNMRGNTFAFKPRGDSA